MFVNRRSLILFATLMNLFGTVLLSHSDAQAVGTRRFTIAKAKELMDGEMSGVSVDARDGVRASHQLVATPIDGASSIWSTLALSDGTVLLGTGPDGKIFRVNAGAKAAPPKGAEGKVPPLDPAIETGKMAITAITRAWKNDILVAGFPGGELYRITDADARKGQAIKPTPWLTLADVDQVWAMSFDPGTGALYVATGPNGKLYRVTDNGKSQVHFDSEEAHLIALELGRNGEVYAGSSGKALLFKIAGVGQVETLYDFDGHDVRAIRRSGDDLFVIANEYASAPVIPAKGSANATGSTIRQAKGGKGLLARIVSDGPSAGRYEELYRDRDSHFVALDFDSNGDPVIGTGVKGQILRINRDRQSRLLTDTAERQVGALALATAKPYVVTTDPVVFYAIEGTGGPTATWTSKVLDAGLRARWGRLEWAGTGNLSFATRSGNTKEADATWSAWSEDAPGPFEVRNPNGRYLQVRARFSKDSNAELRSIEVSFSTDNARAVVTDVTATAANVDLPSLTEGVVASGSTKPRPSSTYKLSWDVDNPDRDKLLYRLYYRTAGETSWHPILKHDQMWFETKYDWETETLAEGLYVIKVEASDELANAPGQATNHSVEVGPVTVDNTAPRAELSVRGNRLVGTIRDGASDIVRVELAAAGSTWWFPIQAQDGQLDERTEELDADVSTVLKGGPAQIAVRVWDAMGNATTSYVPAR